MHHHGVAPLPVSDHRIAIRTASVARRSLLAAAVSAFILACPISANAELNSGASKDSSFTQADHELFTLDKKIILECIRIIRFNVAFHQTANRRWPWRDWLYPIAKEASTGLTFANSVVSVYQRSQGLKDTDLISKTAERKGIDCSIAGHALGGSASTSELTQNLMVALIASHRGFSNRSAIKTVKSGINTVDLLLADREKLVAQEQHDKNYAVRVLQGKVLKHIRNQVIYEFTQWSVTSRAKFWRETTFYAIDAMQSFTSMNAAIMSKRALQNSDLSGRAAITSLVAHSLVTLNPLIRTTTGRVVSKYQDWRLSKVFGIDRPRTMPQLRNDWTQLEATLSRNGGAQSVPIKELIFLVEKSENFDEPLAEEDRRLEHLQRVADQQAISGPLIGLTKIAESTSNIAAHYGCSTNPGASNKVKLAGKISDLSGQSYSLLATPTAKILQFRYHRRLAREGKLPSQIMQGRLHNLDNLEKQVTDAQL